MAVQVKQHYKQHVYTAVSVAHQVLAGVCVLHQLDKRQSEPGRRTQLELLDSQTCQNADASDRQESVFGLLGSVRFYFSNLVARHFLLIAVVVK